MTTDELRDAFNATNTAEPLSEGWPGLERYGREIERRVRQECWETVNAMIVKGPLQGNGMDAQAQRNGIVLAANVLFISKESEKR